MQILKVALFVCAMFGATAASAERVGSSTAICRSAPSTHARSVARLSAGTPVSVLASRGAWSRVRPEARPTCWVASRLLAGDGTGVASTLVGSPTRHAARRASRASTSRHHASRRSTSRSRRSFGGFGGSCPCGGGNVCIGPRGGRYCITSGGNKRYGV